MKKDGEAGCDVTPGPVRVASDNDNNVIQTMNGISLLVLEAGRNFDFAIDEALARAGNLLSASRIYVMLDEKDGRYLRNTHEWVNHRVGPAMFSWPLYDYEYDIPSMKTMLEENGFFTGHAKDMPEDLRGVFQKQNVKSIIIAAIVRDGVRIGLVGADFCETECDASPEQGVVIQFLAGMVALALERKQHQVLRGKLAAIRNTIADIEPLLETFEQDAASTMVRPTKPMTLLDAERRIIIETLELYNGNKLKSAKHLGLTWPSLDRRCKKLGIEVRRR